MYLDLYTYVHIVPTYAAIHSRAKSAVSSEYRYIIQCASFPRRTEPDALRELT